MSEPISPPAANVLPPDDNTANIWPDPKSPRQILTQAGRLYRRHAPEFIALAGVGYGGLLLALLLYLGLSALAPAAEGPTWGLFWLGVVGGGAVIIATHVFVTAALTVSVSRHLAGCPASTREAITLAWQAKSALLSGLVVLLLLALGVVIMGGIPVAGWLLAPGGLVVLGSLLSLLPVVVMIEHLPGGWAVARTWVLLRGHFFRTVGVISALALGGIILLALPTLAMLALYLPFQLADGWLPLLLGLFYAPFFAAGMTLTYLDLRARAGLAPSTLPPGKLVTPAELGKLAALTLATVAVSGLVAAAGLGLLTAGPLALEALSAAQTVGEPAPEFTLTRLDGSTLSLADLRGKPTVINFWATWCPPCLAELPLLQAAYLAHRADLNFVAVSVKEESGVVEPFIARQGLTMPVGLDLNGATLELYGIRGLPTTVFLNAEGVVVQRHIGELAGPALESYLADLLAE
jgi:thiol-disulfide isomerase/thioredoxin